MTQTYRLANRIIQITSLYSEVHTMCDKYRVGSLSTENRQPGSSDPDFDKEDLSGIDMIVRTTQEDIDFERIRSSRKDGSASSSDQGYSDAYLETQAVYRKIAEKMPFFDTILIHGSCVAVDGVGYLFTAKSGTGKSTHTRLWRELFKDRAVMINDDKPLVSLTEEEVRIYGTPWDGKHHLSTNTSVPLKALCILERAEKNTIRPITLSEAFPMLFQQVYRPADTRALKKTIDLISRLASRVDLYRLGCNMEPEAAEIAYEAMKQK